MFHIVEISGWSGPTLFDLLVLIRFVVNLWCDLTWKTNCSEKKGLHVVFVSVCEMSIRLFVYKYIISIFMQYYMCWSDQYLYFTSFPPSHVTCLCMLSISMNLPYGYSLVRSHTSFMSTDALCWHVFLVGWDKFLQHWLY